MTKQEKRAAKALKSALKDIRRAAEEISKATGKSVDEVYREKLGH